MKNSSSGFTLIELIIVIVILGVLAVVAAPRFVDFTSDARKAAFTATAAAFREGVNQVHLAWLVRGKGVAVQNFLPIADPNVGGALTVNSAGYPADTRGVSRTLNSEDDCLDVWRAVLDSFSSGVGNDDAEAYSAEYVAEGKCIYSLKADLNKNVTYDSNTGEIGIND
ncbi:prepilin-type N-terminal cleavage/methylation domain-containing protein [Aliiglaciecola sp. LCG003]|uniref:prepilin-type N-terminal cleavage/methylation domain-containing protein n=1 Tax=Aliiglaciecola sp. LCG003 TaxID=3053655 RepID=UPI0025743DF0|nr:prepilin-type N-terminal cleavage/methylation domain-containing protein [Aliiglaciecola sp. LCG003]WJG10387.1 prepilin-type N-terminal cleavage/methylation domain-containing protein [Aliiglaciecola sp. LCG003]